MKTRIRGSTEEFHRFQQHKCNSDTLSGMGNIPKIYLSIVAEFLSGQGSVMQ